MCRKEQVPGNRFVCNIYLRNICVVSLSDYNSLYLIKTRPKVTCLAQATQVNINYVTTTIVLYYYSTSSRAGQSSPTHLAILSLAFRAAVLFGRKELRSTILLISDSSILSDCLRSPLFSAEPSNGYSLVIGLFVRPFFVRMFAALTSPSFPRISSLMIANFQFRL